MAQQLGVLAVLPGDLGLIPSTYLAEYDACFWHLKALHAHGAQ